MASFIHGGGEPQVGEVTRLAVVEKMARVYSVHANLQPRGPGVTFIQSTRRCCVVARHVNRENGGRTQHFGGQCSFPLIM